MSLVSLVKVDNSDLKDAIESSLNLINWKFDSHIRNVVIKPNLCYYWHYSTGETTDPGFVSALVDLLKERYSSEIQISIVESDASAMKCQQSFRILGYEKMASKKAVSLVNLTTDKTEEVQISCQSRKLTFSIPLTLRNADLIINVPKIKYMLGTKVSCALKNIFGCNPYPQKFRYHPQLDTVIVALNKAVKTDLCLVDGVIVRGKHTAHLGLVMASEDLVATDSAAARILGLSPQRIKHIVLAKEEGLGSITYRVVGEAIDEVANLFPRRNVLDRARSTAVNLGSAILEKLGIIDE